MNASAGTVEAPADRSLRTTLLPKRRRGPSISFPELVWLHHLRQDELKHHKRDPYEGPAETRYRAAIERFEEDNGPIVEAYWCTEEASAVAVTLKRRPLILPDVVRLHWATDWSTKDQPTLMALLYRCEALAVRVHEVLRDTSQRLAMQSLYTVMSYLLAFGETERAKNEQAVEQIERTTRQELKSINSYYHRAAVRSGQIVYVGGMLLGLLPLAGLIAIAILLRVADWSNVSVRIALVCFAAGGVGALISVMSRMNAGRVNVDWEFGKDTLRTLGALRPFVGGVFGVATFFALKSGVVALQVGDETKSSYFYILFGFIAGFSERFARDMLLGATGETSSARGRPRGRAQQPDPTTEGDPLGAVPAES
jgi:hypothetical protein